MLRNKRVMVIMVKKLTPDGSACRKCLLVENQLLRDGLNTRIDKVLYTGAGGEGDALAQRHSITVAPFFVLRRDGAEKVYNSYLRLRRDLTGQAVLQSERESEIAAEVV